VLQSGQRIDPVHHPNRAPTAFVQSKEQRQQRPAVSRRDEPRANGLPIDAGTSPPYERCRLQEIAQVNTPESMAEMPYLAVAYEVNELMLDRGNPHPAMSEGDGSCPVQDLDRLQKPYLSRRVEQFRMQIDLARTLAAPELAARVTRCVARLLERSWPSPATPPAPVGRDRAACATHRRDRVRRPAESPLSAALAECRLD
jgi:hypothetical protein